VCGQLDDGVIRPDVDLAERRAVEAALVRDGADDLRRRHPVPAADADPVAGKLALRVAGRLRSRLVLCPRRRVGR
jgi:hypothetical protein